MHFGIFFHHIRDVRHINDVRHIRDIRHVHYIHFSFDHLSCSVVQKFFPNALLRECDSADEGMTEPVCVGERERERQREREGEEGA